MQSLPLSCMSPTLQGETENHRRESVIQQPATEIDQEKSHQDQEWQSNGELCQGFEVECSKDSRVTLS